MQLLKRCYKCGKKLDKKIILQSSVYPDLSYIGEHIWCLKCASKFRDKERDRKINMNEIEWKSYLDAIYEELSARNSTEE